MVPVEGHWQRFCNCKCAGWATEGLPNIYHGFCTRYSSDGSWCFHLLLSTIQTWSSTSCQCSGRRPSTCPFVMPSFEAMPIKCNPQCCLRLCHLYSSTCQILDPLLEDGLQCGIAVQVTSSTQHTSSHVPEIPVRQGVIVHNPDG